ncbi:MAG: hypothetical protein E6H04_08435 [Bacillati bacterium ANGP1]|uniref:Type 4 fimbrial biogenesis protein PilX N-terminal domain-containing protein n=1 Tax=Candidatus Segetimicrobium genomatis TaxID=2569760 RepID=A0A537JBV7_9BACT|nr:MAG: hypothetical protein E6H04_08435 [Terrabacteria group bacterium ANGP1]
MMFVLLVALLLSAVTLGVLRMVSGDITEGFGGLGAVQAFNVAEAGVHYGIGKLQVAGANTYAGETLTVTSGATTLGTATIVVNCIDTGTVPPCSGTYAGYRRIVSTSTLPGSGASGGPTRTIVAIIQSSTGGNTYGICALNQLNIQGPDNIQIFGDVASNGTISISTSQTSPAVILGDTNSPQKFTGKATAAGTITCAGGCATQVQGGVFSTPPGPICAAPALPAYSNPSVTDLNVVTNSVSIQNCVPSCNFRNITLPKGTGGGNGNPCMTTTDLEILTDAANPNAVSVMQVNTLQMNPCTRFIIQGVGKLDLRIGAPTGNDLYVQGPNGGADNGTRFGVTTADKPNKPAPVNPGQLTVWMYSSCLPPGCACQINNGPSCAGLVSHTSGEATFMALNGSFTIDDAQPFYGALVANQLNYTGTNGYYLDTSGISNAFSNFNTLRSWKDQ